jgi:hypothetical protein
MPSRRPRRRAARCPDGATRRHDDETHRQRMVRHTLTSQYTGHWHVVGGSHRTCKHGCWRFTHPSPSEFSSQHGFCIAPGCAARHAGSDHDAITCLHCGDSTPNCRHAEADRQPRYDDGAPKHDDTRRPTDSRDMTTAHRSTTTRDTAAPAHRGTWRGLGHDADETTRDGGVEGGPLGRGRPALL